MCGDKVKLELVLKEEKLDVAMGYLYYENEEILKKYYNILSKEQLQLKEVSKREYEGTINIESTNEYVLLTIPYDKGWNIKVDNEEAEVIRVQDALMAIKVGKGNHIINMKFMPDGFMFGVFVSTIGIILFVRIGYLEQKTIQILINHLYA